MSVAAKILKQVEFYFSNSNLPRDKFLSGIVKESEEGWCPIATIASFKRMKQLTDDISVVVAALKTSEKLAVSDDGEKVRRKDPLPDTLDFTERSVYVKGFAESATLDDLEEEVNKHLEEGEKLVCVRMRRFREGEKKFKGSVFLEFETEKAAQRFSSLTIKLSDDAEPLLIMMKAAYISKKKVEIEARKAAKKAEKASGGEEKEQKKGKKRKEPEPEKEVVKDLILNITGLNDQASREDLKEALEKVGATVQFVEYARTMDTGYVRLAETSGILASAAAKKMTEEKVEIQGAAVTYKALEGEEETAYWSKVRENQKNKKSQKRKGGKGNNKGGDKGGE